MFGIQTSFNMPTLSIYEIVLYESVKKILPLRIPLIAVPMWRVSNVPRMNYCHLEIRIYGFKHCFTLIGCGVQKKSNVNVLGVKVIVNS